MTLVRRQCSARVSYHRLLFKPLLLATCHLQREKSDHTHPPHPKLALVQSPRPKLCCCLSCSLEHSLFLTPTPSHGNLDKQSVKPLSLWVPICHSAKCRAANSPSQRACHIKLLLTMTNSAELSVHQGEVSGRRGRDAKLHGQAR